jgi:hypothetical protein
VRTMSMPTKIGTSTREVVTEATGFGRDSV